MLARFKGRREAAFSWIIEATWPFLLAAALAAVITLLSHNRLLLYLFY